MALLAEIVTMSQELNMDDDSMTNFILLKLPTGAFVKALISDESASEIVHAKVNGEQAPKHSPQISVPPKPVVQSKIAEPTPVAHFQDNSDSESVVFGGEIQSSEATQVWKTEQKLENPPPKPPVRKVVRVEKDELGYPILRTPGSVDTDEITGVRDRDEDGISQG